MNQINVYIVDPNWLDGEGSRSEPEQPQSRRLLLWKTRFSLRSKPAELPVWASDTEVYWNGSGFTESSMIVWNGAQEPTKFFSDKLSTIVKPSTVQAPAVPPGNLRRGQR